jgi:hypothetical protein
VITQLFLMLLHSFALWQGFHVVALLEELLGDGLVAIFDLLYCHDLGFLLVAT